MLTHGSSLPVPKIIDLYDTTAASVIIVIDSGQSSDDDPRGLSKGACQYTNEK